MIDLHCHLLPGVDDGSPTLDESLELARRLVAAGFTAVAASPHFGVGPGGDVSRERADEARQLLREALDAHGIALALHLNAEHYVSPELFERAGTSSGLTTLGGESRWVLVELPWEQIPSFEHVLFRLQAKGYKLLLAHPERYAYVDLDACERLVERGARLQVELGSFVGVYGARARERAEGLADRGLVHVLASDLHRAKQAEDWLVLSMTAARKRFGDVGLRRALVDAPMALLRDCAPDALEGVAER